MPELRWTLLIIGVLFIAILAWWERRRPHQASRQAPHIGSEPRPVVNNDPSWAPDVEPPPGPSARVPHIGREPTLTLPEIRTEVRTRAPIAPRELPIVEIGDALESDEEISEELEEISEEMAEDASEDVVEDEEGPEDEEDSEDESSEDEPSGEGASEDEHEETREKRAVAVPPEAEAAKAAEVPPPPSQPQVKPIVEWPPEDQRKVVSFRLVARPPERLRGSLVRQALFAEGFVLGDFDIFHKPDAQNRAVLSVASLTKPGTFDLDTMDTQRYVGLNLFAVLPGPKSPRKAFEDLLMAARMLNERLEGALQDERGGPLTPMRIQALRDALEAEAK
jgi:cell division protein ZipA